MKKRDKKKFKITESKTKNKRTILVVEANKDLNRLIQKVLREKNFRTKGIQTGATAIKKVSNNRNVILLLDNKLPDMTGKHVIETLINKNCKVPFIIICESSDEKITNDIMKLGASDYIYKNDFSTDILINVIKRVINKLAQKDKIKTFNHSLKENKFYSKELYNGIAAYKKTEEVLLSTVEKLKAIFEGASDGILAINLKTKRFGFANPKICEITGYSLNELLKLNLNKIHPKKLLKYVMGQYTKQIQEKLTLAKNIPVLRKDKKIVYCDVNSKKIKIGNKKYLVGFYRDITEHKSAEEALRESENRYRLLIENSTDVVWTMDMNLNFTYISPSIEEQRGYTIEEAMALSFKEILTPASLDLAMNILDEEFDLEKLKEKDLSRSRIVDLELYCKDGSTIWTEVIMTFLRNENDQPIGIQGIARNINNRKLAEDALRAKEEKYRTLFQNSSASISLVDRNGVVIDCNKTTEIITGYSREEIIGKSFENLLTLDSNDLPILTEKFEELLTGQDIKPLELEITNKDGKKRWVNVLVSKLLKDKDIAGFQIIAGDVTERKHAEEALRESEEKFRELANLLPQIVFEINLDGNFTFANRFGLESCGYTQKDLDKGLNALQLFISEDVDRVLNNIQKILRGEQFEDHEYTILRKDGSTFPALVYSNPIIRDGESIGLRGIVLDITERKRIEEELKKTLVELERSNKELEQFAYIASHDLKEPLRVVSSYVQLLQKRYKGKLDSDADEFIDYAVNSAKQMHNLINDLLSYSRISTRGKDFEPTDTEDILNQALSNLGLMIEDSGAVVTHDPLPLLSGDEVQLGQLFQNLLSNAIKFRGDKPPKVHVSVKKMNNEWIFSVTDNGIGIDQKYIDRAFSIFQRLHNKDEYPGTGIGLAVCKRIVERHKGRIWVESKPRLGTTFYFSIPILEGG